MNIDSQIRRGLVSLVLLFALAATVGSHARSIAVDAVASDALAVCAAAEPVVAPTAVKLQWRDLLPAALPIYHAK